VAIKTRQTEKRAGKKGPFIHYTYVEERNISGIERKGLSKLSLLLSPLLTDVTMGE
jgi:hypothetical protein